jgi:hypothetical protein
MPTTREKYAARLRAPETPDCLNPAEEVELLHGTNQKWALVLEARARGHIAKNHPYLSRFYFLEKLAETDGAFPETSLDEFNRAIYEQLKTEAGG